MINKLFTFSIILVVAAFGMFTCNTPLENQARDTAAAAQGFITAAQTAHGAECKADPTKAVCVDINRAVDAQNILIDAAETYCGWQTRPTPAQLAAATASCQRISSASSGLQVATGNLQNILADIKAVSQ